MYAVLTSKVEPGEDDAFVTKLFETLEEFVQSSTFGEFEERIALLGAFQHQLAVELQRGDHRDGIPRYVHLVTHTDSQRLCFGWRENERGNAMWC